MGCQLCSFLGVLEGLCLFLVAVFPEGCHVFEGLALGLRNESGYKPCGDDADDAIHGVGEEVTEFLSHVAHAHIVDGHERARYNEVEDPLECHCDGDCLRADCVGEYF